MRKIVSPLDGFLSPFGRLMGGVSPFALYAANGIIPQLIADFSTETYAKDTTETTFSDLITHSRNSNATMVDADGLLKWAPHNLLTISNTFSGTYWTRYVLGATWQSSLSQTAGQADFEGGVTATILTDTASSGRFYLSAGAAQTSLAVGRYTREIVIKASGQRYVSLGAGSDSATALSQCHVLFDLDAAGVVVATEVGANATLHSSWSTSLGGGWYLLGVDTTSTQVTGELHFAFHEAASLVWGESSRYQIPLYTGDGTNSVYIHAARLYRSDLGGMVNNPDTGNSYVPTTTAAVYSPRRGNHVYNGSAWVNEGLLLESEARTNLVTYSNDLKNAAWTKGTYMSVGIETTGSPFSTYCSLSVSTSAVNPAQIFQIGKAITSGVTYVGWALVKHSAGTGWFSINMYDTGKSNENAWFDVQNGVVGATDALIIDHDMVDYGDGWWLCWASSAATSASGGVSFEIVNGNSLKSSTAGDTILCAGTQFEAASTPSSYIPTAGATATRAAETLTVPAANMPAYTTAVSIQMDGLMTYADTGSGTEVEHYYWAQDAISYVKNYMSTASGRTGQVLFVQRSGDLDFVSTSTTYYSPDNNVPFNIAARHGSTFINAALEGTALTANTTPTALPYLSATDFQIGSKFMGNIGKLRVWADDIGDTGIAEASA